MASIQEGSIPFADGRTWYRITRPERPVAGALPLIVLHGGPGFAHDYLRNLAELGDEGGRTVIHYDQFGCGRSTHRPDAPSSFWTPELFVQEFDTLVAAWELDGYHLLGQSWGGMLGAEIAVRRTTGLRSLAICNSPAAMPLWSRAADALRAQLPAEVRSALERHEADGTYEDPEYLAASRAYDARHVVRMPEMPADYLDSLHQMEADPTVYRTMNGPNEFHVVGTLREWSIIDRLDRIDVPTVVLAGEHDEAQPIVWEPFVERIPGARGFVVPDASHCTHLERPEEFRRIIGGFLAEHDAGPAPADAGSGPAGPAPLD